MSIRTLLTALGAFALMAAAPGPVVLQGDYGYARTHQTFPPGAVIDATRATWRLNNSRNRNPTPARTCKTGDLPTNPYPLRISGAAGGMLLGGRIVGETPQNSPASATYCNSAGLLVQSPGFTVRGAVIERAWDGIRTRPPEGSSVRLEGVRVDGARDDCIENDHLAGLEVRDSLLDGCFAGVSLDPGSCKACRAPAGARYVLDRVLLGLRPYPLENGSALASGVFLKTSGATPARIEITNSVFAFEDLPPRLYPRTAAGWEKIGRCANNRLLYLGGAALPQGFPKPPACFTVVTGERARREWAQARSGWLARR